MMGSVRARLCPAVLAALMFTCVLPGATAPLPTAGAYSITVIDVPGALDTRVTGINDAGDITGGFCAAYSNFQCRSGANFLRTAAGKILPLPGVSAIGINNKGEIVGEVPDTTGGVRISLRSAAGAVTVLNYLPGMPAITVRGINDTGQIVGEVHDGLWGGFIRQPDGTVTTFVIPGSASAPYSPSICCIISDGTVLGHSQSGAPFLRIPKGTIVMLNVPRNVYVSAMNNAGTLAGVTTFHVQTTLWVRSATGSVTTFDLPPDWEADGPTGINSAGHIVGTFFSHKEELAGNARAHSFLAVPR